MVVRAGEDEKATLASVNTRKGTVQSLIPSLYPGETEVRCLCRRCVVLVQIANERARMQERCCC